MKLTKDDIKYLNEFLNKELVYRETFEELYDHISSGLENAPESLPFNEALKNYVTREFGGISGLRKIEEQHRATVLRAMKRQYFNYIYQHFRFPGIILLVLIAALVYTIFSAAWFPTTWYFPMFLTMSIIVSAVHYIRYIRIGYIWKSTKRSVKDDGFTLIKYAPGKVIMFFAVVVFVLYRWFIKDTPLILFDRLSPIAETCLFVAYALHAMSFYKMYAAEFKVDLAK